MKFFKMLLVTCVTIAGFSPAYAEDPNNETQWSNYIAKDIHFKTHDNFAMSGRLVLPQTAAPRAVVIYVQTAEGATKDMRRPLGNGKTFNYYDLYREKLPAMNIGFFSYEGRGIQMGDKPPRYEKIDWEIYNTSTLENKVRDLLTAIDIVRSQDGLHNIPILLMGASEGTLLATEAAARKPDNVQGLVLYGVMSLNLRETFRSIMSSGSFLLYHVVDQNNDGVITKQEWANVVKRDDYEKHDINKDGRFTAEDLKVQNKKYIEAIDNEDYETLQTWAKNFAAVSIPDNWFRDHFSHPEIWNFMSRLDIPIGCFQGQFDAMTPVSAVRALEIKSKTAGLNKIQFHYFKGLDHTLNIAQYFVNNQLPEGHRAIFNFIDRIAPKNSEESQINSLK